MSLRTPLTTPPPGMFRAVGPLSRAVVPGALIEPTTRIGAGTTATVLPTFVAGSWRGSPLPAVGNATGRVGWVRLVRAVSSNLVSGSARRVGAAVPVGTWRGVPVVLVICTFTVPGPGTVPFAASGWALGLPAGMNDSCTRSGSRCASSVGSSRRRAARSRPPGENPCHTTVPSSSTGGSELSRGTAARAGPRS